MSYKTTKKDFAEFKKEAEYWIEYFGLINWDMHFQHIHIEEFRAQCWVNVPGKRCDIELATEWGLPPKKKGIKLVAFHEVCELMLRALSLMAEGRYANLTVQSETHDIIRRLENTIFREHRG